MAKQSWIGQKLGGRYEVLELLGQGGMAAVYKAHDPNLNRVVAVKLIHPHLSSDGEFVKRFRQEAAAVAQFRHPNIVQVYDFNNDGDTYYIIFEYVPGESLQDRLKRLVDNGRSFPMDDVIKIASGIGSALDYAHRQGVVHRDVKPANVMLNIHGDAILMDFGIVKMVGGTQHTATGAVVGTARYMSPEQIRGQVLDGRSDIYSLGTMLYEMVAGKRPFESDSAMSLMMMHISDPVPDITKVRPDTPPGLAAVVNKALAKDPANRYQSAGQLVSDLRKVAAGEMPTAAAHRAVAAADMTIVEAPPASKPAPPPDPTAVEPPSQKAAPAVEGRGATVPPRSMVPPAKAAPPPVATPPAAAAQAGGNRNLLLVGGVVGVLLLLLLVGYVTGLFGGGGGDENGGEPTTVAVEGGGEETAVVEAPATTPVEPTATTAFVATAAPTETTAPTETIAPTETAEPTLTAEPAATSTTAPTATVAPTVAPTAAPPTEAPAVTGPDVAITGISIANDRYMVDYVTNGYTEVLPGMHVHFYWNNISAAQAGVGGGGSWFVWGGPRPFDGFTVGERPSGVTAMCAVVANADHTSVPSTGNCWDLP